MSAPGQGEVHERLAPAVTAYRRSLEARTKERQGAAARAALQKFALLVAPVMPEQVPQAQLMLAELQGSQSPWTDDDRWANALPHLRVCNAVRVREWDLSAFMAGGSHER